MHLPRREVGGEDGPSRPSVETVEWLRSSPTVQLSPDQSCDDDPEWASPGLESTKFPRRDLGPVHPAGTDEDRSTRTAPARRRDAGQCHHSTEEGTTRCAGPFGRREFLRVGLAGFGSLSLPGLFHLRARAASAPARPKSALIVVWLHGGASHLESFDPKPDAPSEYRGPYQPIATRVPGLQFCELFPRLADIADRFTVLRSLVHTGFCHDDGPQQIFTGHPKQGRRLKPEDPDLFSIANYLRADPSRTLPNYVGVNPIPYLGSAYLGPSYDPFAVYGDPNSPSFQVPNLGTMPRGRPNGSAGASACGRASTASAGTSTGRGTSRPSTPSRSRRGTC